MIQAIWEQVQALLALGHDVEDVGAVAMVLRTIIIYAFTLAIVRLGSKRFLSLSRRDLNEALRQQGRPPDPSRIRLAYLERDGSISVVPHQDPPRVLDVSVNDGVQTVRVEMT